MTRGIEPERRGLISGYTLVEEVHRGHKRVVYRALRAADHLPVVIKMVVGDLVSEKDVARLTREFEILKRVEIDGVVKAIALQKHAPPALVMEDVHGESLRNLIDSDRVGLKTFLPPACRLCEALGELHRQGITHRDITPNNIVLNVSTGQVRLIDFGIASSITLEKHQPRHPNRLEGTLAYIAPEQTGRMNRVSDHRVDLYSLGVILYELATGQLPFQSSDPLETIHAHIAKVPTPPDVLAPSTPPMVSAIIMRLLAKNAEDRYQSAHGLLADLEVCDVQWRERGSIEEFRLGRDDFSVHFHVSQKLYGREAEISTLIEAFERVGAGPTEMLLVSGYSGIGKSALVNEVHKPITASRGNFISGKFDQFRRNIPYSALVEAFQSLIRQLLTEEDRDLRAWREKLLTALGTSGQVIIDVIPEVELLIGSQPAVPAVGATENQNRFNRVFQAFSAAFAQSKHPLVIFLDDLQWADIPTLHLIKTIVTNPNSHHLLFIGSYRDNEVDETHPLTSVLTDIGKLAVVNHITLAPLPLPHVTALIADTLGCGADDVATLAALVHDKTGGNPFFVNMFLRSLEHEHFIAFDGRRRAWTFDLQQIHALNITDNVVDLMVRRIRTLPAQCQSLLSFAASIGNRFNLKTLSLLCELSPAAATEALGPSIQQGLLLPGGDDDDPATRFSHAHYRFLHDRVQQAAYSLIPDTDRAALHLRIGRLLLSTMTMDELDEQRFAVVDHLNAGEALVSDHDERMRLAELNLGAVTKAKLSSAYQPALKYVAAGRRCLSDTSWDDHYDLTFSLHLEQGELEYLAANWDRAIATFDEALAHAKSVLDRCRVNQYKVMLYRAKNELRTSLNIGLEALGELGVHLSEPDDVQLQEEVGRFYELVGHDTERLFNLPELEDPQKLTAMVLLRDAMNGAFFIGSRLLFSISMKMVEITIQHGNSPHACVAYMYQAAFTLAGLVGDFDGAHRFGKLALRLNEERYRFKPYEAIILNNWGGFIAHHTEDVDSARQYFDKGYYIALENGMYTWTGYCAINRLYMSAWGPDTLQEVFERVDETLPWLKRFDQNMAQYFCAIKASLSNARDVRDDWRVLPESIWPNADAVVDTFKRNDDFIGLLVNATCRLTLANWHGDYRSAIEQATIGERYVGAGLGMAIIPVFHFHRCLAYAAAYSYVDPAVQAAYLEKIASILPKFELWSQHAPRTYGHRLLLIQAELARIEGNTVAAIDLFEKAIRAAADNGFGPDHALASERCAQFWLSRGHDRIGMLHMAEAYFAYDRWGAKAKVKAIEARYPQLFMPATESGSGALALSTIVTGSESLDLTSVLKASQVISSEMVLTLLIEKLMTIALENAGAQKGVLILEKDGEVSLEAEGSIARPHPAVRHAGDGFGNGHPSVPLSVVNYVRRTSASLVVPDAVSDSRFVSDPYVAKHRPRSVLCIPILNQGRRTGVLYLENNVTANAFKHERIQVMQMICSQAAISLDNAHLYDEMTQEVAQRQRAEERERALLEVNNAIISNLTQDALFKATFRALRRVVPFDRCGIFLHDRTKHVLTLAAIDSSRSSAFSPGYELSLEEGHSGWAFTHQAVSLRGDLRREQVHATDRLLCEEGLRSLCAVPLVVRGQSVGAISVLSETPDQYTDRDGDFLREIANQVALAIENMKSYRGDRGAEGEARSRERVSTGRNPDRTQLRGDHRQQPGAAVRVAQSRADSSHGLHRAHSR